MGRTRRHHSYRRDRRWNPGAFDQEYYIPGYAREMLKVGRKQWGRKLRTPEEYRAMRDRYDHKDFRRRGRIGIGKFDNADDVSSTLRGLEQLSESFRKHGRDRGRSRRRNPGHDADFVKHFRDGGRIEVWNDGEVCVFDSMDRDQDDYHIKPHEVPNLIRDVNAASFGAWHHYTKDMVRDDYEMQGRGKRRNPRGRKRGGRSFTRARRGRDWERAVHSSLPWFANPRRGRGRRRNPDVHGNAGKAHPAYGQYLLKLGFAMNDPIVELGAAWARGEAGGSRLIRQAIISAERSMESRDRRVAQNAKNVANKLRTYLKEQERHEGYRHKSGFKEGSLVGSFRYANPRGHGRRR